MKQMCPHCLKSVTVPDDAAGKDATCPECGKSFPVPAAYNASVSPPPVPPAPIAHTPAPVTPEPASMSTVPPAAPPGYVPPATTIPQTSFVPPPMQAGYSRSIGVSFSPRVFAWLPALCLTLVLVSTIFGWVGAYVGGPALYSQGPWRAMFGSVTRNFQMEEQLSKVPGGSGMIDLDKVKSDWELMLPFLLCLVIAVILAWAERGMGSLDAARLPPPVRFLGRVWPHRNLALVALTTLAFIFSTSQALNGFGLQRAAKQMVAEKYAGERKEAAGSNAKLNAIEFKEEQEYAKFNLERTGFLYAGLALQLIAVFAIVTHMGLLRRGNKPPPRLMIQY